MMYIDSQGVQLLPCMLYVPVYTLYAMREKERQDVSATTSAVLYYVYV